MAFTFSVTAYGGYVQQKYPAENVQGNVLETIQWEYPDQIVEYLAAEEYPLRTAAVRLE